MLSGAAGAVRRTASAGAVAFLGVAAVWDAAGAYGWLPLWWPPVSHALVAAGVAAASIAILVRTLQRRRGTPHDSRATAVELVAVGLFLGAWLLRGHAEIPPDPPLVAAQLVALLLFVGAGWRRWRRADRTRRARAHSRAASPLRGAGSGRQL